MELLDLPPELFQQVAHEFVSAIGVRKAWKLRIVSRTFASYITHDILSQQSKERLSEYRNRELMRRNLKHYLYNRVKVPFDVNPIFLNKVRSIADYLFRELDVRSQAAQDTMLMELCEGLATITEAEEKNHILHALWGRNYPEGLFGHPDSFWDAARADVSVCDKLAAAIATHSHDLVRSLLKELPGPGYSEVFFGPLNNAVALCDLALVNIILEYLKTLGLDRRGNRPLRTRYLVTDNSGFYLDSAIFLSLSTNQHHVEITQALLDFRQEYLPLPSNGEYSVWLKYSIIHGNIEALEELLQRPHRKSWSGSHVVLAQACATKDRAYVDLVLDHLDIKLDEGSASTFPLFVAVRSGSVACIEAILERDPTALEVAVRSNLRTRGMTDIDITALDLAVHRQDFDVVKCLLDHDADLPAFHIWPRFNKMYDLLRDTYLERDGSQHRQPGYPEFLQMTDAERRAWKLVNP